MESLPLKSYLPWIREHSRICEHALAELPSLKGLKISCSTHLDPKMIPFFEGLLSKGAELAIGTCNPATVRQEVLDVLQSAGAQVFSKAGMTLAEYEKSIEQLVEFDPDYLCEIGADLSEHIHLRNIQTRVKASIEATGSGLNKLRSVKLKYPVFEWDTVPLKVDTHNRVMVGLTACHTFFHRTGLTFHGKKVHVVGYGPVGEGVCQAARVYGGEVSVSETIEAKKTLAFKNGVDVLDLKTALPIADVVITATGANAVLGREHFELSKDGQFLMNVGHLSTEIDTTALRTCRTETVLPFVERVHWKGKRIYLFAGGHMANLTAGFGDSLNAFDVVLGIMVSGIGFVVGLGRDFAPGLYQLPEAAWKKISPQR